VKLIRETLCLSAFVAKNNRAFAPLRALRETILRGKIIREFVATSLFPPKVEVTSIILHHAFRNTSCNKNAVILFRNFNLIEIH
jgi:hypothetical protein